MKSQPNTITFQGKWTISMYVDCRFQWCFRPKPNPRRVHSIVVQYNHRAKLEWSLNETWMKPKSRYQIYDIIIWKSDEGNLITTSRKKKRDKLNFKKSFRHFNEHLVFANQLNNITILTLDWNEWKSVLSKIPQLNGLKSRTEYLMK